MNRHQPKRYNAFRIATGIALVGCLLLKGNLATADDGLDRLMNRAAMDSKNVSQGQSKAEKQIASDANYSSVARLIPNSIEAAEHARKATHNAQEILKFTDSTGFAARNQAADDIAYPTPLAYGRQVYGVPQNNSASRFSTPGYNKWNPNAGKDEYVFDGNDRGERVRVDQSWDVHGLETQDTIGHFDTIDGRRIVTPSNRVAIYAPRFGAVRRVDGVFNARLTQPVVAFEEKTPVAQADGHDGSSTTKQHLALNHMEGANRASGLIDRTRGVVSDSVTHLFGVRNNFEPFENLSLMRIGKWSNVESARLDLGIQSALVWEDDLGLQVVTKKISPIIVRNVRTVQELVTVDAEDGTGILRVTKIASRIAARTGETVDFTIRLDNLSDEKIGNVTIIDNLTGRLEYVPDSAESSLKADFISQRNDGGSLMLRWEIIEPMDAHTGGIIRFKCKVR